MTRNDLRNIAIVAHVDHGKTTLLNEMLKQGGAFRENQAVEDRVMDSGDLERERGITITSKNTALHYKGTKINVIDTPGHADFGGEVERILKMVDGILLLVDAFEGCMPQTRFVLQKAMELGHKIIVVVNKIDRPDARLYEIEEEVLELLLDLNATEEQLDSPVVYCSGRDGIASFSPDHPGTDLQPLFDKIIEHIDPPQGDADGPLQMMVSSIDYNDYVGRIAVGRITRGSIRTGKEVTICDYHNPATRYREKVAPLYNFDGMNRIPCETATVGDIVCVSGIENITIGETMCDPSMVEALPFQKISQPTVEMTFGVNTSPLAGREGKYVTSRQIRDRLHKELLKDVSLRVSDTDSADTFLVAGRGEMHLSILIETMRREGYEFQVSNPHAMFKEIDGVKCEPIERLVIDVPDTCTGVVMEKMGNRKGELQTMVPQGSRVKMEFLIPARGLFGYKNEFLTDTKGEGIMASVFDSYAPYKGDIPTRNTGSLISFETGTAVVYGLYNAQERGQLFIGAGVDVYEGMIVGQSPKAEDLVVNVCKEKHLTNTRSSGSDDALRLVPPKNMSLEQCIEFIAEDELIEVTPKNLRMRKVILDKTQRMKAWAAKRK